MLREALGREIGETEQSVKGKLQEVWSFLAPILKWTHDPKIIGEKILTHPDFQGRRNNQNVSEYTVLISKSLILSKI